MRSRGISCAFAIPPTATNEITTPLATACLTRRANTPAATRNTPSAPAASMIRRQNPGTPRTPTSAPSTRTSHGCSLMNAVSMIR